MAGCCNRNCDSNAMKGSRRCHSCESQYKSNQTQKRVWKSVDIGKGVCSRLHCNKFAGDNDRGICDMHETYRIKAKENHYYRRDDYKERQRLRNGSTRLNRSTGEVMERPKQRPVGIKSIINSHGDGTVKEVDRMLKEIYS